MRKEPAYTIEKEISSDSYLFKEVGGIQPYPKYITISSAPYPQIYYSHISNHNTHHSLSFCFVPLTGLATVQFPITTYFKKSDAYMFSRKYDVAPWVPINFFTVQKA